MEKCLHIISRADAKAIGMKRYFSGKLCPKNHDCERELAGGCFICQAERRAEFCKIWNEKNRSEIKEKRKKFYEENKDNILLRRKEYYENNKEKENRRNRNYALRNKIKTKAYKAIWAKENKERLYKKARKRIMANPEKEKLYKRQYALKNFKKLKEAAEKYRKENPHIIAAGVQKRRALKLNATPAWYSDWDDFVMKEAADLAKRRQECFGFKWHVDHMVPIMAKKTCGLHCADNIQVIPEYINLSKGNKMIYTKPLEWMV